MRIPQRTQITKLTKINSLALSLENVPHSENDPQRRVSGFELWQWWQQARQAAIAASVPPNEVDWLLQEVAELEPLALRLESFKYQPQIPLRLPSLDVLSQCWQQRLDRRVPIQYLTGTTPWRQFSLTVSPAVLIPRPETECLIDLAIAAVQADIEADPEEDLTGGIWVDLGTGRGAIACALALAFPAASIHAVDLSPEALIVAQQNSQQLDLHSQIQFHQGSWWEPLASLQGKCSAMVANPPYIPSALISQLQPEVAHHEPHLALDGGDDGLDCVRHLVETASDYLRSRGLWLVELMADQAPTVVQHLQRQGSYHNIQIHPDLAGIDRFVLARRI